MPRIWTLGPIEPTLRPTLFDMRPTGPNRSRRPESSGPSGRRSPAVRPAAAPSIDPSDIQRCQPRIALSAAAGALWFEGFLDNAPEQPPNDDLASADPTTADPTTADPSSAQPAPAPDPAAPNLAAPNLAAPDLFDQAKQIRGSGLTGAGQTAVVIDTGIAPDHVTLGGRNQFGPGYRVVGGYDFAEDDAVPYDDGPAGFHGTHVASVLGGDAVGDAIGNTPGGSFQGIAPEVDLVSLRVFDDHGRSDLAWIESALQWVHDNRDTFDHPITTVNLSIGAGLDDATAAEAAEVLGDQLAQLREDGILVFAAAGNFFDGGDGGQSGDAVYPASDPNVIAVSSIDDDGRLSDFSQRPDRALSAVGSGVQGGVPQHVFGWDGSTDELASLDGSSLATPQIAGASIVVRQALQTAGLPFGPDEVLEAIDQGASRSTDPITGREFRSVDLTGSLRWIATSLIDTDIETSIETPIQTDPYIGNSDTVLDLSGANALTPDADGVVRIDGGDGADTVRVVGSDANDRIILRAGTGNVSEIVVGQTRIELTGFESIDVDASGGDRVTLYDSRGDDLLTADGDHTRLSGVGYEFNVRGASEIYVHSVAGGTDRAILSDTAGDDSLVVRPEFVSMRSEGLFRLAFGFEDVAASSTAGGHDTLSIYDSAGDDTLYLSHGRSVLVGAGYRVLATDFESTTATAANPGDNLHGGTDQVRVYLDDPEDLIHDRHSTAIRGGGITTRGFERTAAFVNYQPLDLASWTGVDKEKD